MFIYLAPKISNSDYEFIHPFIFCHFRWVRGICEAIRPLESMSIEELIRLWAHEALRLFHDRLVLDAERQWTIDNIDETALKHFPSIDRVVALGRPILYSNWMTENYVSVDREKLRGYVKARLKVMKRYHYETMIYLFKQALYIYRSLAFTTTVFCVDLQRSMN